MTTHLEPTVKIIDPAAGDVLQVTVDDLDERVAALSRRRGRYYEIDEVNRLLDTFRAQLVDARSAAEDAAEQATQNASLRRANEELDEQCGAMADRLRQLAGDAGKAGLKQDAEAIRDVRAARGAQQDIDGRVHRFETWMASKQAAQQATLARLKMATDAECRRMLDDAASEVEEIRERMFDEDGQAGPMTPEEMRRRTDLVLMLVNRTRAGFAETQTVAAQEDERLVAGLLGPAAATA